MKIIWTNYFEEGVICESEVADWVADFVDDVVLDIEELGLVVVDGVGTGGYAVSFTVT